MSLIPCFPLCISMHAHGLNDTSYILIFPIKQKIPFFVCIHWSESVLKTQQVTNNNDVFFPILTTKKTKNDGAAW